MSGAAQQHAGFAAYQNIGKLAPIFFIVIDDERDLRVFENITNPFEFLRCGALRFLVDGRIKIIAVEDKTNRNDMRLAMSIRSGEMGDAGGAEEGQFLLC